MAELDNTIRVGSKDRGVRIKHLFLSVIVIIALCIIWFFAAHIIDQETILPTFEATMQEFFKAWTNTRTVNNLLLTMWRVTLGVVYGVALGTILGLIMGYSDKALQALSPIVNSIRQVPIMAWVPVSIIWFGIGDGPTIFLIFMSAVFPLIINVIAGVCDIDRNYFNAARSMGANTLAIFKDVVIPGSLPSFITGVRLAFGGGWMSVICAEFIATSSGFGYLMIEAQERIQTPKLYALMIMSAIIGYAIDQILRLIERKVTAWRFKDGEVAN